MIIASIGSSYDDTITFLLLSGYKTAASDTDTVMSAPTGHNRWKDIYTKSAMSSVPFTCFKFRHFPIGFNLQ